MCAGILLDTCVISQLSKPQPIRAVCRWLESADDLAVPAAAIIELQKGVLEKPGRRKGIETMRWFESIMSGRWSVIGTCAMSARLQGIMLSKRELRPLWQGKGDGVSLAGLQDIGIAATAIAHDLPLATFNVRHFLIIDRLFPLPGIFDPLASKWHGMRMCEVHRNAAVGGESLRTLEHKVEAELDVRLPTREVAVRRIPSV